MTDERQYTPDGFLIVSESDCCPRWEAHREHSLWLCQECWFCKWSDFQEDLTVQRHTSVCHNEENRKNCL